MSRALTVSLLGNPAQRCVGRGPSPFVARWLLFVAVADLVVRTDQAGRYAALLAEVEAWEHEPSVADLDGFAAEVEATDR